MNLSVTILSSTNLPILGEPLKYISFVFLLYLFRNNLLHIVQDLYFPPQRRQGPDPRPLLLLVGTPSAFGPELAYRLRVAQPSLMDVPIFLIYFYITIYVCVPHFFTSPLTRFWRRQYGRLI